MDKMYVDMDMWYGITPVNVLFCFILAFSNYWISIFGLTDTSILESPFEGQGQGHNKHGDYITHKHKDLPCVILIWFRGRMYMTSLEQVLWYDNITVMF